MGNYVYDYGQWAVDEIKVQIIDDTFAIIKYEQYIINAPRHEIRVWLNPIDRVKGKTLKEKIDGVFNKLKNKLLYENEKIKTRQKMERKYK